MIGTFGGGEGEEVEFDFLGGAGGGVIGRTFTLQSFELRFGEILAGKLRVFVHWDKLRTIFSLIIFKLYSKQH